jgi:hypothetical protein
MSIDLDMTEEAPATGDVVQFNECGRAGIILEVRESLPPIYGISTLAANRKMVTFWVTSDKFKVLVKPVKKTPIYHRDQSVVVEVNGKEWSGRIAGVQDSGDYVVDLLITFPESEIKPYIQIIPGH